MTFLQSTSIGAVVCCSLVAPSDKFIDYRNYLVSGTPEAVDTADLNHDGTADVIVATHGGVDVLLGRTDGSLGAAMQVSSSSSFALAIADFNDDGHLDIASTTFINGSSIALGFGRGNGTFQPFRTLPNRCENCALSAADFNRDGTMDLALANTTDIRILFGVGNGTFLPGPVAYPTFFANSVVAGDLNGDSFRDLVVLDFGAHSAIVLLNNGNGTFQRSDYPVGSSPFEAELADLNTDGYPDLSVNERDANQVYVFLNRGGGLFGAPAIYAGGCTPYAPQGCSFEALTSGDFNADGKADLATPGSVLLGNGDGTLRQPLFFPAGAYPQRVVATRLNPFHRGELIVANGAATNISVVSATGRGYHRRLIVPGGDASTYVADGDFNADGKRDLAVAARNDNSVHLLLGIGDGSFNRGIDLPVSEPAALIVTDFNRDGVSDIAAGSVFGTWIYLGKGDGTFRPGSQYPSFYGDCTLRAFTTTPAPCLAVSDINNDGIADLVGANWIAGIVLTMFGNGDGTFRGGPSISPTNGPPLHVTLADFDNDNRLDLAVTEFGSGVFVYTGHGDGAFSNPVHVLPYSTSQSASAADMNEDGRLDLVVAGGANQSTISLAVHFVPGNGNGGFGQPVAVGADMNPNAIAIADVNDDGHLDIVSANYEGYDFSVNLGSGNGTFSTPVLWGAGHAPAHVIAADLNGDGTLDIVTANHFSDNLTVALHRRF